LPLAGAATIFPPMARYIALLRAINVGKHLVKMDKLRALFEDLGFDDVETFIASGQVIFDARASDTSKRESKIEKHLRAALGYDVATFIRTPADLRRVTELAKDDGRNLYVFFTRGKPVKAAIDKLLAYASDLEEFEVHGSEVYWYSRTTFSQSKFTGALLEKAIGMPATARNINTIRRLVAKY
jgi:uncharacterized protein (DUF1697 family)